VRPVQDLIKIEDNELTQSPPVFSWWNFAGLGGWGGAANPVLSFGN
jgi:hypothetical protein